MGGRGTHYNQTTADVRGHTRALMSHCCLHFWEFSLFLMAQNSSLPSPKCTKYFQATHFPLQTDVWSGERRKMKSSKNQALLLPDFFPLAFSVSFQSVSMPRNLPGQGKHHSPNRGGRKGSTWGQGGLCGHSFPRSVVNTTCPPASWKWLHTFPSHWHSWELVLSYPSAGCVICQTCLHPSEFTNWPPL